MERDWINGDSTFMFGDDAPADTDTQYVADQFTRGVQQNVSALVKMRIDPRTAENVARNEGQLLSALAVLQLLCSELREVRVVVPFRQVK